VPRKGECRIALHQGNHGIEPTLGVIKTQQFNQLIDQLCFAKNCFQPQASQVCMLQELGQYALESRAHRLKLLIEIVSVPISPLLPRMPEKMTPLRAVDLIIIGTIVTRGFLLKPGAV